MRNSATASQAETEAQRALDTSPIFALRELTVTADGDRLLLSGRVPTFYYKQLAQEAVRAVVNDVQLNNTVSVD